MQRRWLVFAMAVLMGSCGGDTADPDGGTTAPPSVSVPLQNQAGVVGAMFSFDATAGGSTFSDPAQRGLSYAISFNPSANGLSAASGRITGMLQAPGVTRVTVEARDGAGRSASTTFAIVAFAAQLTTPTLPAQPMRYAVALPAHFVNGPGSVAGADNTPLDNPITDAGATLGRVLFYDPRVSANDAISCGSCHRQQRGFADSETKSLGFTGGRTGRHAMGLANARFYQRGRFFWDERAATLEQQVVQPIQDGVEMGMTLDNLVIKLGVTSYYAALFTAAFGDATISSERIARALAQFVRSMVSGNSKFDAAFAVGGPPNFSVLSAQEQLGMQLFNGAGGCARCHGSNAHIAPNVFNNGLDATITDEGSGGGRFKAPSLRNVAVRAPYMHDGRFPNLELVVEHYNSNVQNNPGLDPGLRGPNGQPRRLQLTTEEKAALVAFMGALTDSTFLTDAKFSNPFSSSN